MGWLSRTTGCLVLLALSAQAEAGARIAYPTPNQMYALLGSDVQVTFGTEVPIAAISEPAPSIDASDQMPLLRPARYSFADARFGFVSSARDYGMSPLDAAAPLPMLQARTDEFWNIRQDVFPEQQRIRLRSLTDGMLSLSVGGSSGPRARFSIDGGVAGALWMISRQ